MADITRWRIDGYLTTKSPLRIGDGDYLDVSKYTEDREKLVNKKKKDKVSISSVIAAHDGKAYIPGSTLKGCIRSWLKANNGDKEDEIAKRLFGYGKVNEEDLGRGGIVEFWDCFADSDSPFTDNTWSGKHPLWDPKRFTAVEARTAIDRRTRTARDEKLFHFEYVPPEVKFKFTATAQFNSGDGEDGEEIIKTLLGLLDNFTGEPSGIAVGSDTGNGWGRLLWEKTSVKKMGANEIKNWINGEKKSAGWDVLADLPDSELGKSEVKTAEPAHLERIDISLRFDGQFMVKQSLALLEQKDGAEPEVMTTRRDQDGRSYLPASSFRGALRSHAERILRTICGEKAACDVTSSGACKAIKSENELERLCPACKIFGASGWKSPISVTDFTTKKSKPFHQEFVAIDRFTGGSAHGKKFSAAPELKPELSGIITLDTRAFELVKAKDWGLGLLALTLKDLVEGDIRFGMGSSKGWASCKAEITCCEPPVWLKVNNPMEANVVDREILEKWIGDLDCKSKEILAGQDVKSKSQQEG